MPTPSPSIGRAKRSRFLLLLALVGAVAGMVIATISLRMESSLLTVGIAIVGAVVSIVSAQASLKWWKEADEAVKQAHKTGWYWGGSAGLSIAAGIAALLLALEPTVSLKAFAVVPGDAGLIVTGLVTAIGLAFVGYGVAWAAWWLRNR